MRSSEEKKVASNAGVSAENKTAEISPKPVVVNEPQAVSNSNEGSKMRENPWMISTIVLILILAGLIIFGGIGKGGNSGGVTGNVVSEQVAAGNLISFIEKQGQGNAGDTKIVSAEQEGQLYKVTVDYKGQNVPVYVSLDGKYLIADPIPLDIAGLPPSTNTAGQQQNTAPVTVELGDSPVKGNANAPITIVEFSDYQCPYCGKFFSETLPSIDKDYIKTGKVKYKDFPLGFHENAQKASEAARCVGEQKGDAGYFKMHDKLYANQNDLGVDNLKKLAKELGVDSAKFDKCLDDGKFADAVKKDLAYGQQLGVSGTPAFFVNEKMLSGAQPYSVFKQMIDAELAAIGASAGATPKPSVAASPKASASPAA